MPTEFCHILGGFRGFPGGLNLEFSAKKSKKIFRKKNSKKFFRKKFQKIFSKKQTKISLPCVHFIAVLQRGSGFHFHLEFSAQNKFPKNFPKKFFQKNFSKKSFPKKNFSEKKQKNFTAEGFAASYNVALVENI